MLDDERSRLSSVFSQLPHKSLDNFNHLDAPGSSRQAILGIAHSLKSDCTSILFIVRLAAQEDTVAGVRRRLRSLSAIKEQWYTNAVRFYALHVSIESPTSTQVLFDDILPALTDFAVLQACLFAKERTLRTFFDNASTAGIHLSHECRGQQVKQIIEQYRAQFGANPPAEENIVRAYLGMAAKFPLLGWDFETVEVSEDGYSLVEVERYLAGLTRYLRGVGIA